MKNILKYSLVLFLSLILFPAAAQTNPASETEQVYIAVEELPRFPGGEDAMMRYLSNTLQYPAKAQHEKLEGMVVLQFVVDKTGSISDIEVIKPLGGGLSEEAVRVVRSMPRWIPGKQNGKPVNVKLTLPVQFALSGPKKPAR